MTEGLLSPAIIVSVALGSALGGMIRYWIGIAVDRRMPASLPLGTLLVNVSGALLIGLMAAWLTIADGGEIVPIRAAVVTGFLGSYTTVSAFSLQTLVMVREGRVFLGVIHVAMSVGGCLLAAFLGLAVGRFVPDLVS